MKKLIFVFSTMLFPLVASAYYVQQPMAQGYGAQVNMGAFMQGQAAGQAAFLPAYRQVPTIGETQAYDPCQALRYDNTVLRTQNGQAMPAVPGAHQ